MLSGGAGADDFFVVARDRTRRRGRDATMALVADCCLGYYRRDQLRGEAFRPQPPCPAGGVRAGGSTDKLRL